MPLTSTYAVTCEVLHLYRRNHGIQAHLTELVLNLNRIVLLLTGLCCRDNQRNTQAISV